MQDPERTFGDPVPKIEIIGKVISVNGKCLEEIRGKGEKL